MKYVFVVAHNACGITKLWQEFRFSFLENELMKLLKWYFAILIKIEWKTFREKYIAKYITFAIDIYISFTNNITSRNLPWKMDNVD